MKRLIHWVTTRAVASTMYIAYLITFSTASLPAQDSSVNRHQAQFGESAFHRTWQIGAFGQGGFALDYHVGCICIFRYRKEQEFYTLTFEAGRMLTAAHGPWFLKGRLESLAEVTPFWISHSPPQENEIFGDGWYGYAGFPPYSVHGLSFTPLLLRWNLTNHASNRIMPWLQGGGGVLWTSRKFPQGGGYPGSSTSYFNFPLQVGVGENLFVRKNQSLNVGVRLIGYGSAGLGEYNPGVPYTLNFGVGYSWWK